ncbi:MAG TPA: DEAD/DEAH box helicase [Verrucomicrobiae bacterium]|jgi:superfamily II DNA/RNA helicase|nr:DEAD/DEAH box helicase [Verrucomicrobiae bacterium]
MAEQLEQQSSLHRVTIPDLWQQEAVAALRAGKDVVVQAPTGAGKTLIFELWSNQGRNRGQAIYTVPTRALANDKLAEWRARGWDVGIATGDLAENLSAPVLVATLETQKRRLIEGDGPALLVVDEYQMIGDPDRGLNYELALALAPPQTQLLLLSGSVANPQQVVAWLQRLGRSAVLIRHEERPVPLEEVIANNLNYHVPAEIRGYWPRLVAKALAEDLGPVLIFAPRRQAAEAIAGELARLLPTPNPLALSVEQKALVGESMARLLKTRVTYHHSGLSYAARAGVVEPLAKAGQLRVVVATMGLAAGINFSLRSVALAADSYRRDNLEQLLRGDEILQMFGRAGRRGLDETGFILITANQIRLLDARPGHLARGGSVDWSALLGLMSAAVAQGSDPFVRAVRAQERLFTTKPIALGIEECVKHPVTPCGLKTDAERARHVRQRYREMLNSRGAWERTPAPQPRPWREILAVTAPPATAGAAPQFHPALSDAAAMEKVGMGDLRIVQEEPKMYGRVVTVVDLLPGDRAFLVKWVRRLTQWNGRELNLGAWRDQAAPLVEKKLAEQGTPVLRFVTEPTRILAHLSLAEVTAKVPVDAHGVALWRPMEREVLPPDCARCPLQETCKGLGTATGVALIWRRLGLVDARGVPTRRGQIVSFFAQGDGLAIAAALQDESYPLDELIYDLANLDASFRFCGEENRWSGRLARVCQQAYGRQSIPGYLENGAPPKYGAGAEQVVAAALRDPLSKFSWTTEILGVGDIDRVIIEWRSILRQIAHAPDLDWPRWRELQQRARETLQESQSPTLTELPPLEYHQTKRIDHRLILRRH